MANLLYLVHRMPYPPNKGDKVRSYHLLKHLVARHRVFVGTFIDDVEDEAHVDTLRALCAGLHVKRLHPARARFGSLTGLLGGKALTLGYYRDAALDRWVRATARNESIDAGRWPALPPRRLPRSAQACRGTRTPMPTASVSAAVTAAGSRWIPRR